jgi:glycosyltransferase involved in cell wall biosynthesis
MKKVIFITDSLTSGGAERVMSILATNLALFGYDITILSKSHKPAFYDLDYRVKLMYPKTQINYKNKIATLFTRLHLYFEIYKFLEKEIPDLVVPFSTTTNGTIIPICRLNGFPVIACEHNNFRLNIKSFPIWFIKRFIYPHANLLTVLTERDKKEYYGKFMKNVVVMPNPLPLVPIRKVNLQQRHEIILAVGNVTRWEQKGFDKLLEIFSLIAPKYPEWQLFIAGSGNPSYLAETIQELKLTHRVSLLGEVKDIQIVMQQCSIFTMTSRWEGLPMVLIEAMSQGMACIAFDCFTGPGDVISNGLDGILVEDQLNVKFITKLSQLIENKDLRLTLGTNAIETSKRYLPEKIVQRWHDIIEYTLGLHE